MHKLVFELVPLVDELSVEEAGKLVAQTKKMVNQLQELKVIKNECSIITDYARWFCSKKYSLKLCDKDKFSYDALSRFDEKIVIKSKIGSEIDFTTTFDGLCSEFDFLYAVFIDKKTWMISSVYKVSHKVVTDFLTLDSAKRFKWCGESRSLSLQLYPDEENSIFL